MSVWLIRHTRPAVAAGLCYGRAEVPLAETFLAEAAVVRAALAVMPTVVWSSPAERCVRLAETWSVPVRGDERLRELDFGEWEGRRWEDFRGEASERWAADPWRWAPPGGETGAALEARVAAVRREVQAQAARMSGGTVAVITHGGVVRAWRRLAEGLTRDESLALAVPFGWVGRVE